MFLGISQAGHACVGEQCLHLFTALTLVLFSCSSQQLAQKNNGDGKIMAPARAGWVSLEKMENYFIRLFFRSLLDRKIVGHSLRIEASSLASLGSCLHLGGCFYNRIFFAMR